MALCNSTVAHINDTGGEYSSANGGYINDAEGEYSSVTDGTRNDAEGEGNSASSGYYNVVKCIDTSVLVVEPIRIQGV